MTATEGAILGIVQGLTEFLPVSSSGHLILVPRLLSWPDQGLAFDAAIHLGTLGALLAYFRGELRALATGELSRRLALLVVSATVPAAGVGLLLGGLIEAHLRSPLVVAASTALWGVVMGIADRGASGPSEARGDPLERIGWSQGLAVGLAQALALVPGTSRSGITLTAGLFVGLDRATAARFSFLLGIVVTGLAGAWEMLKLAHAGTASVAWGPLAVAVVAAFASGWLAVWFLVAYLRRGSLVPFVIYRLLLAAVIVSLVLR